MKNILFVLGAGSAVDVGFPTGRQLTEQIGNLIRNPSWVNHQTVMHLFPEATLRREMLDRLFFAELPTIDDLLTAYQNDQEFVRFGKTVIAAVLSGYEDQNRLFPMPRESWYLALRNHLRQHPTAILNKSISFLTFNYDRSLEHYLERALVNSNNPTDKVQRFLGRDNFVHAHGQLGNLPWQSQETPHRPYDHNFDRTTLGIAASGIRLPYEESGDVDARIMGLVERADVVCVCGFGFHNANVARAQLKSLVGRKPILITQTGMSVQQIDSIREQFKISNSYGSIWDCVNIELANSTK